MALPTILFDSGTGSDSAASGAGPSTALTGTGAAITNASASVTISDAVALGGVATDGSAVLYVVTASGRKFSKITAISGSSGAWTVTVEDTVWTTGSGKSWAIGGKRATFDDANSRLAFTADWKPGWTLQTATDQTISSTITITTTVGSTAGLVTIQGDSTTTPRVITQTANTSHFNGSMYYCQFKNLKFANSNVTKTSAVAISPDAGSANNPLTFINCIFGDATNKLLHAIARPGTANPNLVVVGCEIAFCTSYGADLGGGGGSMGRFFACNIHDNGSDAISCVFSFQGPIVIEACKIWNNAGKGINFISGGLDLGMPWIVGNTIHNNTSDGITMGAATNMPGALLVNNEITKNGGYGINYAGSNGDAIKTLIDYNNFGTGALANVSGPVNGFTQGSHSLTVDPGYASATTGDFTPSNAATQAGYP